jgi:hypothetical protein
VAWAAIPVATAAIWGVVETPWAAVWAFLLRVSLFPRAPEKANVLLTAVIWVEGAGLLVITMWRRSDRLVNGFVLTALCALAAALIAGVFLVDWGGVWGLLVRISLFNNLSPIWNVVISHWLYAEAIGGLLALRRMARPEATSAAGTGFFRAWTTVCAGAALFSLLCWSMYFFGDLYGRGAALVLVALCLYLALGHLAWDATRYLVILRNVHFLGRSTGSQWAAEFQKLNAEGQAMALRRATPEWLNVTPAELLALLASVQEVVLPDPASSAYWAKRFEIEQILRQERMG